MSWCLNGHACSGSNGSRIAVGGRLFCVARLTNVDFDSGAGSPSGGVIFCFV